MAKKPRSKNGKTPGRKVAEAASEVLRGGRTSKGSKIAVVSAPSRRDETSGVSVEAREFSRRFNEQYRETLRDLSER